jgi:hypothetical protein
VEAETSLTIQSAPQKRAIKVDNASKRASTPDSFVRKLMEQSTPTSRSAQPSTSKTATRIAASHVRKPSAELGQR